MQLGRSHGQPTCSHRSSSSGHLITPPPPSPLNSGNLDASLTPFFLSPTFYIFLHLSLSSYLLAIRKMAVPSLHLCMAKTLVILFFLISPSSSSSSSSSCSLSDANNAVRAASQSTGGAARYVARLLRTTGVKSAALKDCKGQLSDSVDLLDNAATQLRWLRPEDFAWQVDNALTWTSAALTNQDTCLQGFKEVKNGTSAKVRLAVVKRVSRASAITSKALHLINQLVPGHV